METWKYVVGYEGLYEVSDLGNVRRNGIVLKPLPRSHGYLSVWLYDGKGGREQVSVHRIVAVAFVANPNGCTEINHIDECKTNNTAANLEWCTRSQNMKSGTLPQRLRKAQRNNRRSRQIAQYTLDGKLVEVFPSLHEADRRGYAASNVCRCANGHPNYSHAYGYIWRYVS